MRALSLSLVLAWMAVGGYGERAGNDYTVTFSGEPTVQLGQKTVIEYSYNSTAGSFAELVDSLLLLKTNPSDAFEINSENTATVVVVKNYICIAQPDLDGCQESNRQTLRTPTISGSVEATFQSVTEPFLGLNQSYFFCFARRDPTSEADICNYYSRPFNIAASQGAPVQDPKASGENSPKSLNPEQADPILATPTTDMTIKQTSITDFLTLAPTASNGLSSQGAQGTASFSPTTTIYSITATSVPPTGTTTTTLTSEPTVAASTSSSSKSKGLSVGAKVGIALGALAIAFLILLLALFFLRRKHKKRSPRPEQVMLTRGMHQDSFSHALMTEKELPPISTSEAATPIDEPTALPIQRHSTPYTPVPTQAEPNTNLNPNPNPNPIPAPHAHSPPSAYARPAAAAAALSSTVPRRKPTAATMASTVSRGLSTVSHTSSSSQSPPFETYHDEPVYRDARHVPQVFTGGGGGGAAFLHSEEGLTAEEVARLEDEERRIDAAIAEAERRS